MQARVRDAQVRFGEEGRAVGGGMGFEHRCENLRAFPRIEAVGLLEALEGFPWQAIP